MNHLKTSLAVFGICVATGMTARADVFGNFTYTDDGTSITIDGYPDTETGSVTIPSTIVEKPVTRIGNYAFSGCSGLTSVVIPAGVTRIEEGAFSYCQGLTSVTIPSSVTSIGNFAFNTCLGLTSVTIPPGVTSIADGAFGFCSGLTSVTIPSSVTRIGISAFYLCSGLTSVTIPASVTSIADSAFRECTGLTSVAIPSSVTSIEQGAFSFCSGLTSLTISPGISSMEREVFRGCSGLTSVTVPPGVTTIDLYAFGGCSGLTDISLPSSVTYIGDYAFGGCYSLPGVTIPPNVTYIGSSAFENCTGLPSVTIPPGVTSIGSAAFSGCINLSEAIFQGNAPTMESGVFDQSDDSFRIYYRVGSTGFTSPTWYGYPASLFSESSEIAIEHPVGTDLVDHAAVLAFGRSHVGTPVLKTLTIRNSGAADLLGLAVTISGPNASEFRIGTLGSSTLSPGASTTVTVTFVPEFTGSRRAALKIASNDVNENPFDIAVSGTGTIPPAPEITVQQGSGTGKNLRDDRSIRDFGSIQVGRSSRAMVFVIKNDGSARLTNVNVAIKGRMADDFLIVKRPAKSLAPGMSTQFKVIFKPSRARNREASLRISSNDQNESPFRVDLIGIGNK